MKNVLREFSIGEELKALDAANPEASWRSGDFSYGKLKQAFFHANSLNIQ
jgi:hypothetical protein